MKQTYLDIPLRGSTLEVIKTVNAIGARYAKQNLTMTVRQVFYRLVTVNAIANTQKEYKRLVKIITDGRLAGLIDWDMIEDRARSFIGRTRWESGVHVMNAAADNYHRDMWEGQDCRPFVLIEKQALAGVLSPLCYRYDVPLLACKGYPSASVLRDFAREQIMPALADGQRCMILHLGDHDPSGIDMTRDIVERMTMFIEIEDADVNRLALNMPQVERMSLKPNPAKQSDARFERYVRRFGRRCYELDAIEPEDLQALVQRSIVARIDQSIWKRREREIEAMKKKMRKHAAKFKG